ncbi:MAG: type II toxin-antitoxin system RatA family toxin [Rhodobacteraceae bacterium]|nr:type II toxin-antitoxin system RatA family toxin [Paracoccaceae bacterium]
MPKHAERRFLPYAPDQMYALVADVERYPDFLPWCTSVSVKRRFSIGPSEIVEAYIVISFKVFRERFGSRVTLNPTGRRIVTEHIDGPFRYLRNHWYFERAEGGCIVDFSVDFEFNSTILQAFIGLVFKEAMQRIVRAFERRAASMYS